MKLPVHPSSAPLIGYNPVPPISVPFNGSCKWKHIQYTILVQGGIWCLGPCTNKVPKHPMVIMLSKQQSLGVCFCMSRQTDHEQGILNSPCFSSTQGSQCENSHSLKSSGLHGIKPLKRGAAQSVSRMWRSASCSSSVCEVIHMLKGHISVTKDATSMNTKWHQHFLNSFATPAMILRHQSMWLMF